MLSLMKSAGIMMSIENQLLTLTLDTPLHKASPEQLVFFERFCDVSNLFQNVFGISDHTRWLVFKSDKMKSQFIPGKGSKNEPNDNDIARKVAGMRYMLQNQHHKMLCLDGDTQQEIYEKAPQFITNEHSFNEESFVLRNSTWTNIHAALLLLRDPVNEDPNFLSGVVNSLEKQVPTNCNVFCNPGIIQKQLVSAQKLHNILINSHPYVKEHVMLVTHACHRQSSERNTEEILEKYKLILKILLIFSDRFGCSNVGVCTRKGTLAGQTQPHLHDHVLGFNSECVDDQLWVQHWVSDLLNRPIDQLPAHEAINKIKTIMPRLFCPIKGIVFDIGGVVVKQFNKEVEWLKKLFPNTDYTSFLKELTEGRKDENLFWEEMCREHGLTYDDEFRGKWKEIYLESNPICEKVIEAIKGFRERNLKIYALSNTILSHYLINEERGLFCFDGMVHSHQVGMSKPAPEIYTKLLEITGLNPEELLFVDDKKENVRAGQEAGMHAFLWKNEDYGIDRIEAYLNFKE